MRYFAVGELACKHCGKMEFDEEFCAELDKLRERWGRAIIVSSGYRCAEHPEERKKAKPGAHNVGAVDIRVSGSDAFRLMALAIELGWTGIGVAQRGTTRFLHLDRAPDRPEAPRPGLWSY